MAIATIPGYPRIGRYSELKWALEEFWAGKRSEQELMEAAATVRASNWERQIGAGLDLIPVNDFSLYDQVLDTSILTGAIPARYLTGDADPGLDTYFAMARGKSSADNVSAMDMTKWFDTNYHYLVPELAANQRFALSADKPLAELDASRGLGVQRKAALIGPISFLLLSTNAGSDATPLVHFDRLLPVYRELVGRLAAAGVEWIQFEESALVRETTPETEEALTRAYTDLASARRDTKIIVHTAYGHVGPSYQTLTSLPVDGFGFDFTRGPETLDLIRRHGFPEGRRIAAGVVDGRNVWVNDLDASLELLGILAEIVGPEQLMVSSSCSLQHVPYDVRLETGIAPEVRPWLAFAEQKLDEVVTLTKALNDGIESVAEPFSANRAIRAAAAGSSLRRNPAVRSRLDSLPLNAGRRALPFSERARLQDERLHLPSLPTTTIGSFPQTGELRAARRKFERGETDLATYEEVISNYIQETIAEQEALGLDVLVHGEPERNDMVQYFGEQLEGFIFTHYGWVQSYGSRCVRPPIIVGDVSRPGPMTVRWATYAQSLTSLPVKGMLTGPVTILNWSFVRDDQPRSETCRQIALAIRDEVADLEAAGIAVIQIDEPALREGLPLRRADWDDYLEWAVACFRLASGGAKPETQIHTHMCYSEFGDVIDSIAALDADVLSIENARSGLELLDVFRRHGYQNGIGPGLFDIHSPRIPPVEEMAANLRATLTVLDPKQVWVNPDCGLKTRRPAEAEAALGNMVAAARAMRYALQSKQQV